MPVWMQPWSTPPSELSLPGLIQDIFRKDYDFNFVDGGITYGRAPSFDPSIQRYVTFGFIAELDRWDTGGRRINERIYQFNVYSESPDEIEQIMDLLTENFNPAVFATTPAPFRNGNIINCIPGTAVLDGTEYPNDSGQLMRRMHKNFRFCCNRTMWAYLRT